MKKLLIILMLALTSFMLMGCDDHKDEHSSQYWAEQYATEQYNKKYEDYGIIAYKIDELSITEAARYDGDYIWVGYEITIINESGESTIYNIFLEVKQTIVNSYTKEEIISFDWEEAAYK